MEIYISFFLTVSVVSLYGVDSQNTVDNKLQIANGNIKSDKSLATQSALSALDLAKKLDVSQLKPRLIGYFVELVLMMVFLR